MAELEDSLSYSEWVEWIAFHSLYDLPDDFLTTGQIGALVSQAASGKGKPADYAPYFTPPRGTKPDLSGAFAFIRANAKRKRRQPK